MHCFNILFKILTRLPQLLLTMLRLADKIRQRERGEASNEPDAPNSPSFRSASIRDTLLLQELPDLKPTSTSQWQITYPDPNKLHEFVLVVRPKDGFWAKGNFYFSVTVPEGYNFVPPIVKCTTKIWHPNIDEDGRVCLSLLRQSSLDSSGWAPTRKLYEVVWGIESLFSELCDFTDALNTTAADQYARDPDAFRNKARYYVNEYAKR